ncbi:hypothetical protein IQ257_22920 [Coleofasciculus sp. LEGE 07092]|nr:hypothetical protein [Coleofasciculus sp. LEGE 07081]MBE9151288.1 hypothetical protein [Coleofasciculus sp. LEGE 07092]
MTTNNLQISGDLTISFTSQGYRSRLSDLLNNSRSFISLSDVEVHQEGQESTEMSFLCINKPAIAFLFEEELTSTPDLNSLPDTMKSDRLVASASR